MPVNRVLLIEDDDQMANLIGLLVETAAPGVRVDRCMDVTDAEARFDPQRHRLVLCDWNLPGRPGIALMPLIRRSEPRVPVLMITGRTDRASVVAARAQGVEGFIAKPFSPEQIVDRLRGYLTDTDEQARAAVPGQPVLEWLAQVQDADLEGVLRLRGDTLSLIGRAGDPPALATLAERWRGEPVLVARLLALANSSLFNPQGRLCTHLLEALQRLGWRTAANVALALSLREGVVLDDPLLKECADQQLSFAERVAEQAEQFAREAKIDPAPLQSAALLHRLGELAVLALLGRLQTQRGTPVDDADLDAALERFSAPFCERLMAAWAYPVPLRQLVAAITRLPPGAIKPEPLILRLAGGRIYGDLGEEEEAKLRRMVFG